MFLTACTGVRAISSAGKTANTPVTNQQRLPASNKKAALTGPPVYAPDTVVADKSANKIIERGGKYVFIPPAYTRIKSEMGTDNYSAEILRQRARKIKQFAVANNYDTAVAFFIDMQVKSGRERFFVVDLSNNTIIKKGLVAHGRGNEKFTFDKRFSNDEGSNCTSLGVYKIGKAYNGSFGLSYKLYGLNKTNRNALKRYVVLHAMGSIPYEESKWPIAQTEGCPAVAPAFLEELAPILDNAPRNVLLYIYNGSH